MLSVTLPHATEGILESFYCYSNVLGTEHNISSLTPLEFIIQYLPRKLVSST